MRKLTALCSSVLVVIALGLGGCTALTNVIESFSPPEVQELSPSVHRYECEDGTEFTASVEGEGAWLFLPEKTVFLPRASRESRTRFGDADLGLWQIYSEAMLKRAGIRDQRCVDNQLQAAWEASQLRGADFRALGQNSSGELEIENQTLSFTPQAGDQRTYKLGPKQNDAALRKTSYQGASEQDALNLVLEGKSCRDPRSAEVYETTVTLSLGDEIWRGCGRALH